MKRNYEKHHALPPADRGSVSGLNCKNPPRPPPNRPRPVQLRNSSQRVPRVPEHDRHVLSYLYFISSCKWPIARIALRTRVACGGAFSISARGPRNARVTHEAQVLTIPLPYDGGNPPYGHPVITVTSLVPLENTQPFPCLKTPSIQPHRKPFHSQVQKVHSPKPKKKCISEVVRIGSIIIFHLSKLWKTKFSTLRDAIFLLRLQGKFEIDHS